jgi:hypothetical protein
MSVKRWTLALATAGSLADRVGHRRLFTAGLAPFTSRRSAAWPRRT